MSLGTTEGLCGKKSPGPGHWGEYTEFLSLESYVESANQPASFGKNNKFTCLCMEMTIST